MAMRFPLFISLLFIYSCKTPTGVFKKQTAHELYAEKIEKMGLANVTLGHSWLNAAVKSIQNPTMVQLPYRENNYFASERPGATALRFSVKKGEQLLIECTKNPVLNFLVFTDLFLYTNGATKFIQSLDTLQNRIQYTVKENGEYILRIQPELLQSGSYTVAIKTGPSLAYPIPAPGKKNGIISYWGDGRDGGARKHEGVDIGGARGTPLIAVGNGQVSNVTQNNLGGKVIFIRSEETNENWYYAHLDSQMARVGQRVKAGDTIGLMGNTGNASTTAPHLHFGIYTGSGAVDPLPYLNPIIKEPSPITASPEALGKRMVVIGGNAQFYLSPDEKIKEKATYQLPILITGATGQFYKTLLPGGETRYIASANVEPVEKRTSQVLLKEKRPLTDQPANDAAVIQEITAGKTITVMGKYGNYLYVTTSGQSGWIIP